MRNHVLYEWCAKVITTKLMTIETHHSKLLSTLIGTAARQLIPSDQSKKQNSDQYWGR